MANNYKVKMVDLQNKYKFKIFCSSQMYDDTDLKREVEAIYKAFPKASATGTDATLTGTAAALMNLDLKGNGGKNLFKGIFRQGAGSGSSMANRVFSDDNCYVEAGTTYTFSTNANMSTFRYAIGISTTQFPSSTFAYDSGWKYISTFTFTPSVSGYFGVGVAKQNDGNITPSDISTIQWQLEKNSTATDYEPYDASVTGDNTIDICGKNLISNIDIFDGYPNGSVGSTIAYSSSANSITYKKCAYVRAGQTYTLRWTPNTPKSVGNREIYFCDDNNKILEKINYTNADNNTKRTFVPINNSWVFASIDANATEVQLEKGSTATDYEPYQGASYPVNLDTIKLKTDDSIQGSKNNWYIERADGTIEPIADTTLISQLNNLRYNAESYEGQTNISQVNSDMPFIFDASAIKDLSNL